MKVTLLEGDFAVPMATCDTHGEHVAVWADLPAGRRLYCPHCFYEWLQQQEGYIAAG